jgi:hypothetical protein
MKPFLVGFTPLAAFDSQNNKLYTDINIDKEKTIEELKTSFGKALSFAVEIGYATKDTIKFMIGKAGRNSKALEKFVGKEEVQKNTENKETEKEETSEKVKEESQDTPKENKSDGEEK